MAIPANDNDVDEFELLLSALREALNDEKQ
jgi:hypothetical protein